MSYVNALIESQKRAIDYNNQTSDQLLEICSPLFQGTRITTFCYVKMFTDGSWLYINTNKDWARHVVQTMDLETSYKNTLENQFSKSRKYLLYANKMQDLKVDLYAAKYRHNMWHALNVYERKKDHLEYMYFAGSRDDSQMNDFYLHHLDLLGSFIDHFKVKLGHIINGHDKEKRLLLKNAPSVMPFLEKKTEAPEVLKLKQLFSIKTPGLQLTPREHDCVAHLLLGKYAKEIAFDLDISHRTVERHLNNVKQKMNARNNVELAHLLTKQIGKIT